ncbi:MAG: 6-bladed beta-propeller, partial [Candidatus Hydrogenedentales bacterium]
MHTARLKRVFAAAIACALLATLSCDEPTAGAFGGNSLAFDRSAYNCVTGEDGADFCKAGDVSFRRTSQAVTMVRCHDVGSGMRQCFSESVSPTVSVAGSLHAFRTRTDQTPRTYTSVSRSAGSAAPRLDPATVGTGTAVEIQRGDTIVRMATTPRQAGMGTLVEEVSIGQSPATSRYLFSAVREMLPLRNGGLLVVDFPDGGTPEVREFDARGLFVRAVGRMGQGPGEYTTPGGLAELPDGRLLIYDNRRHVINVYEPTGAPLATWNLPFPPRGCADCGDALQTDTAGFIYRTAHSAGRCCTRRWSAALEHWRPGHQHPSQC